MWYRFLPQLYRMSFVSCGEGSSLLGRYVNESATLGESSRQQHWSTSTHTWLRCGQGLSLSLKAALRMCDWVNIWCVGSERNWEFVWCRRLVSKQKIKLFVYSSFYNNGKCTWNVYIYIQFLSGLNENRVCLGPSASTQLSPAPLSVLFPLPQHSSLKSILLLSSNLPCSDF